MPVMDIAGGVSAPASLDTVVLRVELEESLSVKHFETTLFHVRESYDAMYRFMHLFQTLRMNTGQYLDDLYYNPIGFKPISPQIPWETFLRLRVPLADFLPVLNPFIDSLMIKRISIASPGFGEFFGSLNPLKVIADFVTDYRAEDTKRMKIKSDELLKREQLRATFIRDFFKLIPDKQLVDNLDRVVEITQAVIEPAFGHLEHIATDAKVTRVYLVTEGEELVPNDALEGPATLV